EAGGGERWLFVRKPAGFLERRGQLASLDLGGFDVWLIERIDAENCAGDRDRHLEPEKLLADLIGRMHHDPNHRMPGVLERAQPLIMSGIVFVRGADIDKETIVAVKARIAERFTLDRDQPL